MKKGEKLIEKNLNRALEKEFVSMSTNVIQNRAKEVAGGNAGLEDFHRFCFDAILRIYEASGQSDEVLEQSVTKLLDTTDKLQNGKEVSAIRRFHEIRENSMITGGGFVECFLDFVDRALAVEQPVSESTMRNSGFRERKLLSIKNYVTKIETEKERQISSD